MVWILPVAGPTLLIPMMRISISATLTLCMGYKMAAAFVPPFRSPRNLLWGPP